ncbi:hypothetical protein [Sinomonas terrae]|uniref:Uncharacterized protein n=1 Tax=Sinomonas terrae TaxID=2908838 RepID=A0ABS9TYU0_9MICC|nr:hypothetical protein [Sinomonas terrae]MCH6469612.1 hypothetical protein [Sinomonas terrae]
MTRWSRQDSQSHAAPREAFAGVIPAPVAAISPAAVRTGGAHWHRPGPGPVSSVR